MARKKKKNPYFPFESLSTSPEHTYIDSSGRSLTDTTTNICVSMMRSPPFKDLTPRQRMLYIYAKSQFYGAVSRPSKDFPDIDKFGKYEGRAYFYLNHKLLTDVFGLYTKGNYRDLYRDIDALETHGFIERVTNVERKPTTETNGMRTIFQYSDKWKSWKEN